MTRPGPVHADRLQSFIERIERLEEERAAIGSDVRDVYAEAKGVGYDAPAMRRLISYRKLDAADRAERDAMDDVYRHALGMAVDAVRSGMSYREAEAEYGFSKSAIHRASHQTRDSVSGTVREMTEDDLGKPTAPVAGLAGDETVTPAAPEPAGDFDGHAIEGAVDELRAGIETGCLLASAASGQLAAFPSTPPQPGHSKPTDAAPQDIDLTIPAFMRRERQSVPA